VNHDGIEHAGYLSFLLMLAIFPFLFFMMALVSLFGQEHVYDYLITYINSNEADNFIGVLKPRIKEIIARPPKTLLTFAILSAVWTASSIFEAMRTILNRANRVVNPPSYLIRRLISVLEFMVIIFMTSLVMFLFGVAPSLWESVGQYLNFKIHLFEEESSILREFVMIVYGCFLVSFLYCFLPNQKKPFLPHIPGTVIVMLCWISFTKLFNYYLSSFSQLSVIYGSIAGVIISLLYFYFCSVIFIFGAEFNYNLRQKKI
jgi:membrane protein